jgi:hypothetical protein
VHVGAEGLGIRPWLQLHEQVQVVWHDGKALDWREAPAGRVKRTNHPREGAGGFVFDEKALRLFALGDLREGRKPRQALQRHHVEEGA